MGEDRRKAHRQSLRKPAQCLGAELFGTFALTFTSCAVEIVAAVKPELSYLDRGAASGLVVLAIIYATSDISGAHINPAVSLGFALRGAFAWGKLPGYWLAQLAGALAGAALAHVLGGYPSEWGAMRPSTGSVRGLCIEGVLTLLLVSVILHTSRRRGTVGTQAAIAVGGTIACCTAWAAPLTGAAMNPARALAPVLLARQLDHAWLYLAGPFAGAATAALLTYAIRGAPSASETKSAEGEG